MIEMQHVSVVYPNGVHALNDISVCIERGEFVFIVGKSGAGKSTFIKMLCREFVPHKGKLLFQGQDMAKMKQKEVPMLRRNIGVVFQDFRLLENRSVFENVAFALRVTGAAPRDLSKRVPGVLDMVGLLDKIDKKPCELSGGEQQRVCLARALVNQPSLILADEPTGNLDPKTSIGIMDIFRHINIRGTTVVMATHDKDMVDRMRKRVILLDNGRIVRDEQKGVYCQHGG